MQELKRAREIIDDVSKETDSILLFHSLSGKDSIVLLDLCYKKFKESCGSIHVYSKRLGTYYALL